MQKSKRKVAMNRVGQIGTVSDTGLEPIKYSRITKKLVTRGLKMRKKKLGRAIGVTIDRYSNASYAVSADSNNCRNLSNDQFVSVTQRAEAQIEDTSSGEINYSEYGNPAIFVSERDWKLVIDMIENPPDLSPKLLKAIKRYNESVESRQ